MEIEVQMLITSISPALTNTMLVVVFFDGSSQLQREPL